MVVVVSLPSKSVITIIVDPGGRSLTVKVLSVAVYGVTCPSESVTSIVKFGTPPLI